MDRLESWYRRDSLRGMGRFVRHATRLALLAILLPLIGFPAYYVYQIYLTGSEADELAPEAQLVESFHRVVHTSDHGDPAFTFGAGKWRSPVRVFYHPSLPEWHANWSRHQFALLSRLTGLDFQATSGPENARGLSVYYSPPGRTPQDMAKAFGMPDNRADMLRSATCFASYRDGPDGAIAFGYVVFTRPAEERRTLACIVEESTQVLGLQADRATYSPTVFTNDLARPVELTLNDKILIRALYDPAIEPGMTAAQTRALVPGIIHRLVTGVRARGEAALYQR